MAWEEEEGAATSSLDAQRRYEFVRLLLRHVSIGPIGERWVINPSSIVDSNASSNDGDDTMVNGRLTPMNDR